jgi:hypothetical protein
MTHGEIMLTEPFLNELRHTEAISYGTIYRQQREPLWKTRVSARQTSWRAQVVRVPVGTVAPYGLDGKGTHENCDTRFMTR